MLRESKLSECDSCLLVVLECVMGCLQNNQNDQEMDVRKLRFRHPLPGLGGVYRTQKRSGYTRLKILAYFSVCILTLGVLEEL